MGVLTDVLCTVRGQPLIDGDPVQRAFQYGAFRLPSILHYFFFFVWSTFEAFCQVLLVKPFDLQLIKIFFCMDQAFGKGLHRH